MTDALSQLPEALPPKPTPPPTYRRPIPRNNNRLFLRSDCFGLGAFVAAADLEGAVQPGDLVQIDRVLYTEWALYAGHGNVVHVCSALQGSACVGRLSALAEVAGSGGVRVNNKVVGARDRGLEPLPAEDAVQNAYKVLDGELEFNLLTRNSEHYVTEWKYGCGWSDQAAVTMSVMKTLTADCTVGHNVLVSGLNAVLNSPGSPIGRTFSSSPPDKAP